MAQGYVVLKIETKRIVAGVNENRINEIVRIITQAANHIEKLGTLFTIDLPLLDFYGNQVGYLIHTDNVVLDIIEKDVLRLSINTSNAAFEEGSACVEVARILREASESLLHGKYDLPLFDINGETVGELEWGNTSPS